MSNTNQTAEIEKLAASIGENIYIDVAKWHLYLSDAHLHTTVAEQVYIFLDNHNSMEEEDVLSLLENISVKLGGGKKELPLIDLIPTSCHSQLMDIIEAYQRQR